MTLAPEHLDELALNDARQELRASETAGVDRLAAWARKWGDGLIERAEEAAGFGPEDWGDYA